VEQIIVVDVDALNSDGSERLSMYTVFQVMIALAARLRQSTCVVWSSNWDGG
jgi:hypothetical protein